MSTLRSAMKQKGNRVRKHFKWDFSCLITISLNARLCRSLKFILKNSCFFELLPPQEDFKSNACRFMFDSEHFAVAQNICTYTSKKKKKRGNQRSTHLFFFSTSFQSRCHRQELSWVQSAHGPNGNILLKEIKEGKLISCGKKKIKKKC